MSDEYWVEKFVTPRGSVHMSGSPSMTRGSRKAFQLWTIASTEIVASTGRDIGSAITRKNRNGPQPSIAAASSSSGGMARKKGRSTMTEVGRRKAAWGSATPSGLLSRSRLRTVMNSGRTATVTGNSSPSVNRA